MTWVNGFKTVRSSRSGRTVFENCGRGNRLQNGFYKKSGRVSEFVDVRDFVYDDDGTAIYDDSAQHIYVEVF